MLKIEDLNVRGLTRGEIKKLRAEGILLGEIMDMEEEKRDAAIDRLFSIACPELDADDITPGEALRVYEKIAERTFLSGEESKNSDSPQP